MRKLKPYKVDRVFCSRLRRQVDVMFDREDKDFYGVVDGQTIRATALQECKNKLSEFLNNHKELKWRQEIWVSTHDPDNSFRNYGRHEDHYAEISFSFYRLEVSKATDTNGELERPFLDRGKDFGEPEPEAHELTKRELGEDIDTLSRCTMIRLPYSDEVWRGLTLLKDATEQANAKLSSLIKKDGVQFLQNIKPNTLLLAAGSKR
jgi:hypothetical protein